MAGTDVQWIIDGLAAGKAAGKTRSGLAKALKRAPSMVTELLKGDRALKVSEVRTIARYLGVEPPAMAESSRVPIMGYIGAGAEIDPDFEQVPEDGLEDVILPFPVPDDMIAFEVKGNSMLPKYDPGDVVVVRRDGFPDMRSAVDKIAAVRTEAGKRYLKRVVPAQQGSGRRQQLQTFNLESLNATASTIYNVRLAWAAAIFATLSADEVRKVEKAAGTSLGRIGARSTR